jgi:cytochrome P450
MESGEIVKRPIYNVIIDLILWTCARSDQYLFLIAPELTKYAITPKDRLCVRNTERLKREIRSIIDAKKVDSKGGNTLVDVLLQEPLYKDNYQKIEDDILTFFFAGALTIQASTSNLIMYTITHPHVRAKMLTEIDALMEMCKDNVKEKLTIQAAEDTLIYTRLAYMESLRIEPPASLSTI